MLILPSSRILEEWLEKKKQVDDKVFWLKQFAALKEITLLSWACWCESCLDCSAPIRDWITIIEYNI